MQMSTEGDEEKDLGCLTCTAAIEVMAQISGLEQMSSDTLREIMIRVAGQPEGTADAASVFAASKTLRDFAKDGDVVHAVSFKDIFPCVAGRYEPLPEVSGLIARCSRVGNSNAKVALASASKVRDSVEMHCHVKDLVALNLVARKKPQHQQFLITLDKLSEKNSFPLAFTSNPLTFMIGKSNELCKIGPNTMKDIGIDEEVFCPLLQCSVQLNDDVGYNTLMKRLNIIEPVLKEGGVVASSLGKNGALVVNGVVLCIAAMLSGYLMLIIDQDELMLRIHVSYPSRVAMLFTTCWHVVTARKIRPTKVSITCGYDLQRSL